MKELLATFSVGQIILFIVLIAIAFKEVFNFLDWIGDKFKKRDSRTIKKHSEEEKLNERLEELNTQLAYVTKTLNDIEKQVKILMESDKDDIKAFITREHHYFCYTKGWIDDFSLDCIEKRYNHYVEEEGNSFVLDLMKELRALPKQEPKNNKEPMS